MRASGAVSVDCCSAFQACFERRITNFMIPSGFYSFHPGLYISKQEHMCEHSKTFRFNSKGRAVGGLPPFVILTGVACDRRKANTCSFHAMLLSLRLVSRQRKVSSPWIGKGVFSCVLAKSSTFRG